MTESGELPVRGSLASAPIYAEMDKGDGSTCWVPLDNVEVYELKGFARTGQTADWYADRGQEGTAFSHRSGKGQAKSKG